MAKSKMIGISGVARKIPKQYIGVANVARKGKAEWIGANGVSRQFWAGGTPISSKAEGSIVQVKENGALVDFYVAKHNYESGLNGAGRTLLVRKNGYDSRQWHSSNVNAYASSSIDTWLNGTYKAMLNSDVQTAVGTTKLYYTPGNGTTTVSQLSRAVFLVSQKEVGGNVAYANSEGTALSIADTLRGLGSAQWLRSPSINNKTQACFVNASGFVNAGNCSVSYYSRPCFTVPGDFAIEDLAN